MDLGIGRGDSARRVLGKKPTTLAGLEQAVRIIKDLAEGRPTDYDGEQIQMDWACGNLPVWIAGYGPKALALAGRVADGVILQLGDPALIKWCMGFVHEGARVHPVPAEHERLGELQRHEQHAGRGRGHHHAHGSTNEMGFAMPTTHAARAYGDAPAPCVSPLPLPIGYWIIGSSFSAFSLATSSSTRRGIPGGILHSPARD